ncbi:hypothetical protein M413DRAFT_21780 [Hebeloma cylindrosporum]|uniref:F-box domain-containing protein n=1 Tax=Hebeloma cylindrosporum TaxID=76867 RepID=A0A0C3CZM6_HEBCY|nr:hypothetical protein M413DRAFT_21780 [Hebeloma cylindrosporum h7]
MSHIPKLNSDVLDCVLQECPTSSLVVLSLVSSNIHALTLPRLLHSVYLDQSPKQILSFLDFIIDNAHGAGRRVLNLKLDGHALYQEEPELPSIPTEIVEDPIALWAPTFARALAFMPNLLSLFLRDKVEEIASHSSDFAAALLSLPRLQSLYLTSVGHVASSQFGRLMDLKAGITSLQVIDILTHSDIEQLQIGLLRCDLRDFLGEKTSNPAHKITFPKVVKLSLDSCHTYLEDIAIAFPTLHTLYLGFSPFLRDPVNAPTRTFCSFPSLISIAGRQWDIYSVLKCNNDRDHVRRLQFIHTWSDDNVRMSTFVIPQAAPFLKSFSFSHGSVKSLSWWQAFSRAVPHLAYWRSRLYVPSTEELDLLLVQIPQTLASISSLEYISIVVEGYEHVMGNLTSPEIQASTTEQAIALINVPGAVLGSPTWWRVVRQVAGEENDFGVNVKPLDASQGISKKEWYDRAAWGI